MLGRRSPPPSAAILTPRPSRTQNAPDQRKRRREPTDEGISERSPDKRRRLYAWNMSDGELVEEADRASQVLKTHDATDSSNFRFRGALTTTSVYPSR